MKNKLRLFDRGIFFEAINRLKIQGIIGGAIGISSGFILVMSSIIELMTSGERVDIPAEYFYITYIIPFVIVPMMMMVAFSYLKARKTSDFYHSIPIKRESMYFSTILAAIVWIVAILIIFSVIPLGAAAFTLAFRIDMSLYWEIISKTLIASIFVLSCFALGVSLTGNGFTNFFVSVMIVFVPRVVIGIICSLAEEFTPFLILNVGNSLLNAEYNILFDLIDSGAIPYYGTVIYSLVVSCAYLVLGAVAFVKRKSEMAGKPSAFSGVQVVTRMILPFIALLGSLYFVLWAKYYEDYDVEFAFSSLALAIVAFTIYFIYELITTKRIKKVLKSLVWFPVLIGGVAVVGIIITIGSKIALARTVDEDKINYIVVDELDFAFFKKNFVKIESEEAIELIADTYNAQMEYADVYFDDEFYTDYGYDEIFTVGINQGGVTFYRDIYMSYEDYRDFEELCMEEVYSNGFEFELPKYREYEVGIRNSFFEPSAEKRIYNALREDLEDVDYEELSEIMECDNYVVEFEVYDYVNNSYDYIVIPVSEKTPKALVAVVKEIHNMQYYLEGETIYSDYLEDIDPNSTVDLSMYGVFVAYLDEEKAEGVDELYIYAHDEESLALVGDMFKLLEDNHDSKDYDCVIVINGWLEIYPYYEMDDEIYYEDSDYTSLDCKYYVSEEVAEEFLNYISELEKYNY